METSASLASAIARLPRCEREALSLRLERDIKQSEIAAELGCSQMQVSRLLRRPAVRLREMTAVNL
jgi:RNA polymerase sigma-B factor